MARDKHANPPKNASPPYRTGLNSPTTTAVSPTTTSTRVIAISAARVQFLIPPSLGLPRPPRSRVGISRNLNVLEFEQNYIIFSSNLSILHYNDVLIGLDCIKQKVIKIGSSIGVVLPARDAKEEGILAGEVVEVKRESGRFVIEKTSKPRKTGNPKLVAWAEEAVERYRPALEALRDK